MPLEAIDWATAIGARDSARISRPIPATEMINPSSHCREDSRLRIIRAGCRAEMLGMRLTASFSTMLPVLAHMAERKLKTTPASISGPRRDENGVHRRQIFRLDKARNAGCPTSEWQ